MKTLCDSKNQELTYYTKILKKILIDLNLRQPKNKDGTIDETVKGLFPDNENSII